MKAKRPIKRGDTLTLHFKITAMTGTDIDSTFDAEPIQLTLGNNELAENLENCLIGILPGERHVFQLEPWQALGVSDPDLVQQIALDEFSAGMCIEPNNLVEFTLPNGTRLSGTVKSKTNTHAIVDFNHPLSDCPILFEVEVLAIS